MNTCSSLNDIATLYNLALLSDRWNICHWRSLHNSLVLPALIATLLGAIVGTVVSYQGNKRWTFTKARPSDTYQWLRFSITALVYNGTNLALMAFLLEHWPQRLWLMQVITTCALTLITYQINQYWSFRHESIKS